MKKGLFFGAATIVLGILVSVLSFVLLPFCKPMGHMVMRCHTTSTVDGFIGIAVALIGIAYLVLPGFRNALSATVIAAGVLVALVPALFVGVCANPHMPCHAISSSVLQLIGILIALVGIANSVYLLNRSILREESNNESYRT